MSLYLIDKTKGITSADVVREVKKITNTNKVGHGGTLDPFATGLLIVATDEHTKLLEFLLGNKKTYEGILKFGVSTTTYDPEGDIVEEVSDVDVNMEKLSTIINKRFLGMIYQTPPKYSSIKVNGKKAYELARAGVDFDLSPVKRQIYQFNIEKISDTEVKFEITVSSGTYIRSIANDLGVAMKIPAMLTELRRTEIGLNSIADATLLPELENRSVKEVLGFSTIEISDKETKDLLDGKTIHLEINNAAEMFIAKNNETEILTVKRGSKYKLSKRLK